MTTASELAENGIDLERGKERVQQIIGGKTRNMVGCAKCGCLEEGHHGKNVGCEGAGGNCPCDGVYEDPRQPGSKPARRKRSDAGTHRQAKAKAQAQSGVPGPVSEVLVKVTIERIETVWKKTRNWNRVTDNPEPGKSQYARRRIAADGDQDASAPVSARGGPRSRHQGDQ